MWPRTHFLRQVSAATHAPTHTQPDNRDSKIQLETVTIWRRLFFCFCFLNRPCFCPSECHVLPFGTVLTGDQTCQPKVRREQSEYPDQNREQNDQSDVPQVSHAPFTRVTLLTHDFECGQTTTRQQGQQPKASSICHNSGINAVSLKKKMWRFHHPRRKKIIVSKGNDVCLKPHYQFHQHSFQLYGLKIFNLLTIKMRK